MILKNLKLRISPADDLSQSINKAKKSFIEFIEGLLRSSWVKNWFRMLFYFILLCGLHLYLYLIFFAIRLLINFL